jgi:hypothetical protein
MLKREAARFLILTLMSVLFFPGCATLTRKSAQRIPVTSSPVGASVIVNGIERGAAPLSISFDRRQKYVIRIESPGYNPFEIRLRSKISGETILGSFLLGFVPGIVPALGWLGSSHTKTDPSNEARTILSIYITSAMVLGGLFALIDMGNKGYTLTPMNLNVRLTKANGPPRVDTMLIDADDFRNVKWIRVRAPGGEP